MDREWRAVDGGAGAIQGAGDGKAEATLKLSFVMPEGVASEIEIRNVRLKE